MCRFYAALAQLGDDNARVAWAGMQPRRRCPNLKTADRRASKASTPLVEPIYAKTGHAAAIVAPSTRPCRKCWLIRRSKEVLDLGVDARASTPQAIDAKMPATHQVGQSDRRRRNPKQ